MREGERKEGKERNMVGEKNIIYFQLTIRNQDFEEIRMFYWFSVKYLQKYKLKSISELIKKKDWKIKRFSVAKAWGLEGKMMLFKLYIEPCSLMLIQRKSKVFLRLRAENIQKNFPPKWLQLWKLFTLEREWIMYYC